MNILNLIEGIMQLQSRTKYPSQVCLPYSRLNLIPLDKVFVAKSHEVVDEIIEGAARGCCSRENKNGRCPMVLTQCEVCRTDQTSFVPLHYLK